MDYINKDIIGPPLKPLEWVGSSYAALSAFPPEARRDAGYELFRVQGGDAPRDVKPMPAVGGGVYEIRVHTGTEHRVFYVAKFEEAVYVLHAFEKRTQKTPPRDIALGRARLAQVLAQRSGRRG